MVRMQLQIFIFHHTKIRKVALNGNNHNTVSGVVYLYLRVTLTTHSPQGHPGIEGRPGVDGVPGEEVRLTVCKVMNAVTPLSRRGPLETMDPPGRTDCLD